MISEDCQLIAPSTEVKRACRECGKEFTLPPFKLAARYVHVCPECSERHAEADQREAAKSCALRRSEAWHRICPPEFQSTEAHKLPSPAKLQRAMAWRYGPRGLILHGETGLGKSRIGWKLIEREFMAGKSIAVLNCEFGFDYAAKFTLGGAEVHAFIEHKMRADLLFLDDVFKVKLTDSSEQALFAIVNRRTEHRLPIITTTNDTGESLTIRMSDDRGEALIRRLKQFGELSAFDDCDAS